MGRFSKCNPSVLKNFQVQINFKLNKKNRIYVLLKYEHEKNRVKEVPEDLSSEAFFLLIREKSFLSFRTKFS